MPRYFFHRLDGGFDRDTQGTECVSVHAARVEAILYAAGTMRDRPDLVWEGGELRIEVTNEDDELVTAVVIQSEYAMSPADIARRMKD